MYFDGCEEYLKSNSSLKIRVLNQTEKEYIKTKIISDNLTAYYGTNINFTISLVDINENPLKKQVIKFSSNNKNYSTLTDDKGLASFNLNLANGEYIINMTYDGGDNYLKTIISNKIIIFSSIIAQDSDIKTYNSHYKVKFLDKKGDLLINSKVKFVLNGNSYIKTTDERGYAYLEIYESKGEYYLKIINLDTGEELTKILTVISRFLKNKDIITYEYSNEEYKVLLLDDNGHALADASVKMIINGKNFNVKTDKNGYAAYQINLLKGSYCITTEYMGFKIVNNIIIKPVIVVKDISKKKSKTYKLSAKILHHKKNFKVIFKLKNKKYITKTNKNGVATVKVKINLKKGVYKVKVLFVGSTNSFKLKVK